MFGLSRMFGGGATVSPAETYRRLEAGEIVLVDVREAQEWHAGHIPGARHLPLSSLETTAHHLPRDKSIVLYCLSGMRSGRAVGICRKAGIAQVASMAGGIGAWRQHGLPVSR